MFVIVPLRADDIRPYGGVSTNTSLSFAEPWLLRAGVKESACGAV